MLTRTILLLIAIQVAAIGGAEDPEQDISVTGTYTNLEYHERSGDLGGIEATIVYSFKGHYIVIACASGVPVVLPLKVDGLRIEFELKEVHEDSLCGLGARFGEVTSDSLKLWQLGGVESPTVLKRQSSYWSARDRIG
jgi:hypothetical protein